MEIVFSASLRGTGYEDRVLKLLTLADGEFVPPLSARVSATQGDMTARAEGGVEEYFKTMSDQPVLLAIESGAPAGFMSFKYDHACEHLPADRANVYISTVVVAPEFRGRGIMASFYRDMLNRFPERAVCTRTWSTNAAQLHVLERMGFHVCARIKDHRGKDVDTLYYIR